MADKITIIGLGLIGGSLGLAFSRSTPKLQVFGYDSNPEAVRQALDIGAIQQAGPLEEAVREADYVFVCTPIKGILELLGRIAAHLKPGCVVTDVCSTKKPVMELLAGLPPGIYGIGGHPMAGSEKRGIGASDRFLFENAVYVLTPANDTPAEVVTKTATLIRRTGAQVKLMSPGQHDRVVALISHVPHIMAAALVNLATQEEEALLLAAGGFRDTTRIASSSPELWEDILFSNREEVSRGLMAMIEELQRFKADIDGLSRGAVQSRLAAARQVRDSIPGRRRGLIPSFQDVITIVPDRPGIIGQLGGWLGAKGINIVDIEILRVREGDGGTIRLGVPTKEAAVAAVTTLQEQGIKAWVS
jgi:prephenate dehydrogenase